MTEITITLTGPAERAVAYAVGIGLPPERLIEIAVIGWITKNNLAHVLLAPEKPEKPAPRPVGRPPKTLATGAPSPVAGRIEALHRDEAGRQIEFEISIAGDRARIRVAVPWEPAIDARVQLVALMPIAGMASWKDLVGRPVTLLNGTLQPRPQADIDADIAWLEQQDLDASDRAALANVRSGA
jgi:hypothetical protein